MLCKCDQSGPKETLRSSYYFVGLRWQTFGRVQNTCSHNYPQYLAAGPLWLLSCESNLQHTSVNISEQTYLLHGSEFLSKSVIIFTTESCGSSVPQRLIKDLTSLYIDVKTRFFCCFFLNIFLHNWTTASGSFPVSPSHRGSHCKSQRRKHHRKDVFPSNRPYPEQVKLQLALLVLAPEGWCSLMVKDLTW